MTKPCTEDDSAPIWYASARGGSADKEAGGLGNAGLPRNEACDDSKPEKGAQRLAKIWLYGRLAARSPARPLVLQLPRDSSARDAILRIGEQLGRDLLADVLSVNRCCRVCVDGRPVENLDRPLEFRAGTTDIEMILLTPFDGG